MLYKQMEIPESDLTIKAIGNQWYWSYEYPEHGIEFDAIMLAKDELSDYGYSQDEYLLATDNPVVVPVGSIVRMQVTGADDSCLENSFFWCSYGRYARKIKRKLV